MVVRVALLVDHPEVAAWEGAMLKKVAESGSAEFRVLLLDTQQKGRQANPLIRLYESLDAKLFPYKPDALRRVDVRTILPNVPLIQLDRNNRGMDLSDSDVERIRKHEIDVLLHLGKRVPGERVAGIPRFGVWYYCHGEDHDQTGIRQGFWEFVKNKPVIESSLSMVPADNGMEKILVSSFSRTHKLSLNKSRNISLWKSVSFVPRKLAELSSSGGEKFLENVANENAVPRFDVTPMRRNPGLFSGISILFRQAFRIVQVWISRRRSFDQWCLAFSVGKGLAMSFWNFQKITPPRDRFWADPHVIQWNGEYYIFLEEYLYSTQLGHIAVSKIGPDPQPTTPKAVLKREYHLSYPFVFVWNGVCYMIPETSKHRDIQLYECRSFPEQWDLKLVLMENVRAVDTTVFHHGGKWWLYTNIAENDGGETTDELFLFHADHFLTKQWTPHPLNPIVSDVRRARPAGRIFEFAGELYRPSQDCSEEYGGGINFQRIVTLTENDYHEEPVSSSKPEWDKRIIGLHTYSREGEMTVIDLCVRRPR